jgi:hypothetical protein
MYALFAAATNHIRCGNYAAANAHFDELIGLADERGAPYWKALGTAPRAECCLNNIAAKQTPFSQR